MPRVPRMSRSLATAELALTGVLAVAGCSQQTEAIPDGGASAAPPTATASPVRIAFLADDPAFADAVAEYERLWAEEGTRIVAAMEAASGLAFAAPAYADTAIVAQVVEAPSNSGYRERPMRLRASYPYDTKRATLVHELGHRLQSHLFRRDEEEHAYLFLWIYDVWVELWGRELADREVAVEKRRGERYVRAWDSALALSREERRRAWQDLEEERTAR